MQTSLAIPQTNFKVKTAIYFGLLLIAVVVPRLGAHAQPIVGPIVNATLFLAVFYLNLPQALSIAMFPSLIALASGLLPMALAPIVPFIILGNWILCITFNKLKDKSFLLGSISASVLKFLFLFSLANIIALKVAPVMAVKIQLLFGLGQLYTALAGALIALVVIYATKKQSI